MVTVGSVLQSAEHQRYVFIVVTVGQSQGKISNILSWIVPVCVSCLQYVCPVSLLSEIIHTAYCQGIPVISVGVSSNPMMYDQNIKYTSFI